ncbi:MULTISPECIES: GNAT family N-acetyltransferase [Segatella]|uniref:BioF2-like acetyltransferase domain-containing protein n=2 Tax=Segatella TaxID=2974251 RepID=D8DVL0_9BACT|nr:MULTISPECIES: GNAT family N-acetyltransferase [Segatella]MEE3414712.1 GNAT family N-acetyltransferase [Prevotella sp.]EFI72467.1 conserved hypothetical protein [Segatella baroniae B14]UKK77550.1 GNAT family N-acetyltransferase [Segatella baroniae B14]SEQ62961.1 Acetyltransferase (GNAT) domain-containing protein [Segatella baroniae B14]GJG28189.1 hypothetical protein PRRU23_18890 [Segatella bryantii]
MFEIKKYEAQYKEQWDEFVTHSKQGTFLFQRDYMEYHSDRFTDYSLIILKDHKIYALLPGNQDGNVFWSHQGLTYGGIITSHQATAVDICEIFKQINLFLKQAHFKKVIYKAIPWIYQIIPSEEDLYALINICHAQIVTRNIASVVYQKDPIKWKHDRHYGANKARTNGISVEPNDDEYKTFWKILEENLYNTYHAKPVHTLEEIRLLQNRFPNNIKLYVAKKGEQVIGGTLLYITPRVVHAQYISASAEGKHLHAVDALFRKILTEEYTNYPYFDFGTSNEDHGKTINQSLIYQKEGFGGRGVCYDWYEWNI